MKTKRKAEEVEKRKVEKVSIKISVVRNYHLLYYSTCKRESLLIKSLY